MKVSQLFLPEVTEAIEAGDLDSLKTVFESLHPSDLAGLLDDLTTERVAEVIRILRVPKGIDVFEQLEIETQANVLEHLGRPETVKILEELSPDDRVDLLQTLPEETVDSLLPMMAQAERQEVSRLLQYEETTAGALMTPDYASLPTGLTVDEGLRQLRTIAPDTETIYYVYLLGSERTLEGAISLRELVMAKPAQRIDEIMTKDPISVGVDLDQEEVANAFAKYDLLALPVVDSERRLVGIVTYDDAMDVIVEEGTEDAHQMGAVVPVEEPYLQAPFWSLARKRGFWLLILFLGELLTAWALEHYEATIQHTLALVFFLPLIVSSGGNSGSQSVTLITRALAVGEVRVRDFFRVVWRESAMGLVLGGFLGLVGFCRVILGDSTANVSMAVGLALIGVVAVGSLTGAALPLIFKRMGFDPAIMSSPFVASLVDVIGIIIYFSVAQMLIV